VTDKRGLTYRDSGVDIDPRTALARIKGFLKETKTPETLVGPGPFGGSSGRPGVRRAVWSQHGRVGTKLKVAFAAGIHDTVGRDS
jgi:phosphoribosylformylglycinamidine cyclo-ligase